MRVSFKGPLWPIPLLISFFVVSMPCANAENGADYAVGISQKLGRGLVNLLSSPLEVPCTMRSEVSGHGGAGIVPGFFKGLASFLRRVLVGVTEAGTFMIPMEATLPPVCQEKGAPAVRMT